MLNYFGMKVVYRRQDNPIEVALRYRRTLVKKNYEILPTIVVMIRVRYGASSAVEGRKQNAIAKFGLGNRRHVLLNEA